MLEALNAILAADGFTYALAAVLAGLAVVLVNSLMSSLWLGLAYAPVLFFGALSGPYGLRQLGVHLVPDREINMVASAAVGLVAALFVLLALTRLVYAVTAVRTPVRRQVSSRV